MFRVTREIRFCYGHRLLEHPGRCRFLHGHNGRVLLTLARAELDSLGMVVDFGDIRDTVGKWIDENLDHRMILCASDPYLPMLRDLGEPIFVMQANPTAENLAKLIFERARDMGLPAVRVQFWETDQCYAVYDESDSPLA